MKSGGRIVLFLAGLSVAAAAGYFGWRSYAVRRAWREMRPALPSAAGADAPGLDARLAACSARLEGWPPDRAALAEFTLLCHANGFLPEAVQGYQALMKLEPAEGRWPHLLAAILGGLGRMDDALPLLQRATELAPDRTIVWLRWGDALLKANQTEAAEKAYLEGQRRTPANVYVLFGLARCDLQSGRLTAARKRLQQAVAADPKFPDAQSMLATVYDQLGNPAAAAVARSLVKSDTHYPEAPDPWTDELLEYCYNTYTLLVAGSAAMADGAPQKAVTLLQRGLSRAPDDARLHRQLGKTLTSLGDLAGARVHLQKAVAMDPANEFLRQDMILFLRAARDQAGVEQAVADGLAACPGSAPLHFEAGLIAARAGRYPEAAQHFAETWKLRPDETPAPRELADVYFHSGRDEEGVAVLEQVLRQHPADQAVHALRVRHGLETGDPRTRRWLQEARRAGLPDATLADLNRAYQQRFGVLPP